MKNTIEVDLLDEGIVMRCGVRDFAFRDLSQFLNELTKLVLNNWKIEIATQSEIAVALQAAAEYAREPK